MRPLRLLALLLALEAAAVGPASYPTAKELLAQAAAWTAALCEQASAQCPAAQSALAGYEKLLGEAERCERAGCAESEITKLARKLHEIDATTATLPPVAGQKGNSLLRLSALASSRLGAAAGALGKPEAARAPGWDPETLAPKVVERICIEAPTSCDRYRGALDGALKVKAEVEACETRPCSFETIDGLALRSHDAMSATLGAVDGATIETTPVFSVANDVKSRAVGVLAALVDKTLDQLRNETDGFQTRLTAAEADKGADLKALPREGDGLMARHQQAAVGADRLGYVLGYDKAGAKREEVNSAVLRLSGLRGRALALITARGLEAASEGESGAVMAGPRPAKAAPGAGVTLTKARPTLLDRRTVPPASGTSGSPPEILPGRRSYAQNLVLSVSGTPIEKADAKSELGQTLTLGNPGLYARQAYSQDSESGCAVAAQVQVLRAHGLLPVSGDPKEQERALFSEARSRGFSYKGTPPEYNGELLIARNMLVSKHQKASWADLEAAIKRGSVIQAGVNASLLWYNRSGSVLSHSILITGGELEQKTGQLLGVYINDSGTDPPGAGKFIPLETMKASFQGDFAEVR